MTIDKGELTINVIYSCNPDKQGLWFFFTVTLRPFMKYHLHSLFSITQHHKKRWDPPTMCDVIIEQLLSIFTLISNLADNYMFKVNNRNTKTRCPFEHISHLVPVFLLLTLNQ